MRIIFLSFSLMLHSCLTPSEKDRMNADIFDLKTKILTMEGKVRGQNTQSEVQGKTLATSHSRLDKIEFSIQKIQGDMDALRVGVVTGQMPGADPDQEGSIAQSLTELMERLEKVEANQQALMSALDKVAKKSKRKNSVSKTRERSVSLNSLKKSFRSKRYKHVALDAPKFLKKARTSEKASAMFLYAESLYKLGRLRDAALKYNDYIDLGDSANLAHAKMRMGDCFRHLGEKSTAKLYYEELVTQFPSTAEAEKAKERLQKM